jgi:hypothetical protein
MRTLPFAVSMNGRNRNESTGWRKYLSYMICSGTLGSIVGDGLDFNIVSTVRKASDEVRFCVHFPARYSVHASLISHASPGFMVSALSELLEVVNSLKGFVVAVSLGIVFFVSVPMKTSVLDFQPTGVT